MGQDRILPRKARLRVALPCLFALLFQLLLLLLPLLHQPAEARLPAFLLDRGSYCFSTAAAEIPPEQPREESPGGFAKAPPCSLCGGLQFQAALPCVPPRLLRSLASTRVPAETAGTPPARLLTAGGQQPRAPPPAG